VYSGVIVEIAQLQYGVRRIWNVRRDSVIEKVNVRFIFRPIIRRRQLQSGTSSSMEYKSPAIAENRV
jgi:hypothetical protein